MQARRPSGREDNVILPEGVRRAAELRTPAQIEKEAKRKRLRAARVFWKRVPLSFGFHLLWYIIFITSEPSWIHWSGLVWLVPTLIDGVVGLLHLNVAPPRWYEKSGVYIFHILPHCCLVCIGGIKFSDARYLLFLAPLVNFVRFEQMVENMTLPKAERHPMLGKSDNLLSGGIAVAVAVVGIFMAARGSAMDFQHTDNIVHGRVRADFLPDYPVFRQQESLITEMVTTTDSRESFLLLYGPRGCGKTCLVANALADRTGVVWVQTGGKDGTNVITAINNILNTNTAVSLNEDSQALTKRFVQASAQMQQQGQGMAVLVIEVVKDVADNRFTQDAIDQARMFAVDNTNCAKVIVILSDAAAAYKYKTQNTRYRMMWLDDFTPDEANTYLDMRNLLVNDTVNREALFSQVGTRPLYLMSVADRRIINNSTGIDSLKGASVGDFASWKGAAESHDLIARTIMNLAVANNTSQPPGVIHFSTLETVKITPDLVIDRIFQYGHLFAVIQELRVVQPYSRIHWNLLKEHGPVAPFPASNMTTADFLLQLQGLDDAGRNATQAALDQAKVTVANLNLWAQQSKQSLIEFLNRIPNLPLGYHGIILLFYFPQPSGFASEARVRV